MQDFPDGQIRKKAKANLILISHRVVARNLYLQWKKSLLILILTFFLLAMLPIAFYYLGNGWICMHRTSNLLLAAAKEKRLSLPTRMEALVGEGKQLPLA